LYLSLFCCLFTDYCLLTTAFAMSKIRVLSDHLANQISAGEVVERPASVAKELVENAIDAGARRLIVDSEAGGRRLLRVADDGSGMTRDDALLAFERHATSKISRVEDLNRIATLGFRGEALASIASVARVELVTGEDDRAAATRVIIEGGRMRDVKDAAHPRGTTISVRDLFFNVPARRKFLRSEATESFHLTNLITHYALAHPEIAFTLTNNGREVLRATPAADLRERAYQLFGAGFLENLLELGGGNEHVARLRGYVSAPIERRSSRDAQYLFVNGRFVRDRLLSRALAEGYRTVLPPGTYPVALLFLEVPLEEVDVNVHPAKTEVRFRRATAVADVVRETVRHALASAGHARLFTSETHDAENERAPVAGIESPARALNDAKEAMHSNPSSSFDTRVGVHAALDPSHSANSFVSSFDETALTTPQQNSIEFDSSTSASEALNALSPHAFSTPRTRESNGAEEINQLESQPSEATYAGRHALAGSSEDAQQVEAAPPHPLSTNSSRDAAAVESNSALPPVVSVAGLMREVSVQSISKNIRPLGQLEDSFIIAADSEGLLLIDQHAAHERILFDKFLAGESTRAAESQHLLAPVTFDLTPAQAFAFDAAIRDLEAYGFGLMRLSGRTVAIKSVPVELPLSEARNLLAEILETVNIGKRGMMRATSRERIAASLARRAAIKSNTPLSIEKMQWLIDSLLASASPTTCPHGRPVILRLATRDILRGFHRT